MSPCASCVAHQSLNETSPLGHATQSMAVDSVMQSSKCIRYDLHHRVQDPEDLPDVEAAALTHPMSISSKISLQSYCWSVSENQEASITLK